MTKKTFKNVAGECEHFEDIIAAQGYGISMLNHAPGARSCKYCVNSQDGSCLLGESEGKRGSSGAFQKEQT